MKNLFLILILFSLTATAQVKTADQLIDLAVSEKRLSSELGFLYKIDIRFNPHKVPAEFQGPIDENQTHVLLMQIKGMLSKVSAPIQRELIGYQIPPIYAGSKLMRPTPKTKPLRLLDQPVPDPLPDVEWRFIENNDVKVWYQTSIAGDAGKAAYVASIFPAIRKKLDAYTGKTYIEDTGTHRFTDLEGQSKEWADGGNGKLDIYLGPLNGALALTIAYPPGCSEAPAFILMRNTTAEDKTAEATLAHEYMHVLSFTYPHGRACKEYVDVDEGIANWAINYVNPRNDFEQRFTSLMTSAGSPMLNFDYATWPFFLFLEKTLDIQVINNILKTYDLLSSWEAVNHNIDGGFEKQWPLFQIPRWNQIEEMTDFIDWDRFYGWHPEINNGYNDLITPIEVKPDSKGNFYFTKDFPVKALASHYFHFKFTEPSIRSITFEATPKLESSQKLKLKVMIKRFAKAWAVEDWSDKDLPTEVCRDIHDEKIEEIIFAFANVDFPKNGADWKFINTPQVNSSINVHATNMACKSWTGHFETNQTIDRITNGIIDIAQLNLTSNATFDRIVKSEGNLGHRFNAREGGNGTYFYKGNVKLDGKECQAMTSGTFIVNGKTQNNGFGLNAFNGKDALSRSYSGRINSITPDKIKVTYTCSNNSTITRNINFPSAWETDINTRSFVEPDGKMRGSYTNTKQYLKTEYKWVVGPE